MVLNRQQKIKKIMLLREKLRRKLKGDYYEFFKYFWDTVIHEQFIDNWHIKFLCDEVQKVGEWVIKRQPKKYDLIINISPGESKSTIATVLFPVWLWINDPSLVIINNSYSSALSMDHAALSRDCIKSDKFQKLFGELFKIRRDYDAKQLYKNDKGGQRISTSMTSKVTGKHANLILDDDPCPPQPSKPELAQAEKKIKELSSRKKDKKNTPTITIMQRLHQKDPTAIRLGDKVKNLNKKVRHICLPATDNFEVKPAEAKQHYKKGLMNTKRTDREVLAEAQADLGEVQYAGQYGQNPRPLEGSMLKRKFIQVVQPEDLPDGYWTADSFATADLAQTKNERNDPSGIMACKIFQNKLYIFNFLKYWKEYENNKLAIREFLNDNHLEDSIIAIENKSSGLDMTDSLNVLHGLHAVAFAVGTRDKETRFRDILNYFWSGKIVLVNGNWDIEDFIEQLIMFPNVEHDEEADCVVMAVNVGLKGATSHQGEREFYFG